MSRPVRNCRFCGRDTRCRSEVCRGCLGEPVPTADEGEMAEREAAWEAERNPDPVPPPDFENPTPDEVG